ncbi:hypothetical protein HG530_006217 [Fusarium avenaceum]|nr:hypothetical protein HG530_006217 [Fusarium avenaceum]
MHSFKKPLQFLAELGMSIGFGISNLLLCSLTTKLELAGNPVVGIASGLSELSEECSGGGTCAISEVSGLLSGLGLQILQLRTLRHWHTIAIEVSLKLSLGPLIEGRLLSGVGSRGKIAGSRSPSISAGGRGRRIGRLSSIVELIPGGILLLGNLLSSSISVALQVLLEVLVAEIIKSPCVSKVHSNVSVLANKSLKLTLLGALGDRDTTGIKVRLEAAIGPSSCGLVESIPGS